MSSSVRVGRFLATRAFTTCGAAILAGLGAASCASSDHERMAPNTEVVVHDEEAGARSAVGATLDALHDAASKADGARYFALFEADAVFIGTDASERWTLDEFRAYAEPHFEEGRGWTYAVLERHVLVDGSNGRVAWFDERLANAKYGETRGSGVCTLGRDGRWRVAHYVLSFAVPNDAALDVVEAITRAR